MKATEESPVSGLRVFQPVNGFRYGSESFWLTGFALEQGIPDRVIDLGTGSGIVAGLFAAQGVEALGVDIRREWEPYWALTMEHSSCAGRMRLEHRDVAVLDVAPAPLVVANPPFFKSGAGPGSPNLWKRAARTEVEGGLMAFVAAASRIILPSAGRACFVLPIQRLSDAMDCAHACGLQLWRTVQVGNKRVMIEWGTVPRPPVRERVAESDARAQKWYSLACTSTH